MSIAEIEKGQTRGIDMTNGVEGLGRHIFVDTGVYTTSRHRRSIPKWLRGPIGIPILVVLTGVQTRTVDEAMSMSLGEMSGRGRACCRRSQIWAPRDMEPDRA